MTQLKASIEHAQLWAMLSLVLAVQIEVVRSTKHSNAIPFKANTTARPTRLRGVAGSEISYLTTKRIGTKQGFLSETVSLENSTESQSSNFTTVPETQPGSTSTLSVQHVHSTASDASISQSSTSSDPSSSSSAMKESTTKQIPSDSTGTAERTDSTSTTWTVHNVTTEPISTGISQSSSTSTTQVLTSSSSTLSATTTISNGTVTTTTTDNARTPPMTPTSSARSHSSSSSTVFTTTTTTTQTTVTSLYAVASDQNYSHSTFQRPSKKNSVTYIILALVAVWIAFMSCWILNTRNGRQGDNYAGFVRVVHNSVHDRDDVSLLHVLPYEDDMDDSVIRDFVPSGAISSPDGDKRVQQHVQMLCGRSLSSDGGSPQTELLSTARNLSFLDASQQSS
eukprot:m.326413 g.326413  ORF g.326413 m.326413 type:complete len:395 (+) comp20404_c0_seq2:193-1377(+)